MVLGKILAATSDERFSVPLAEIVVLPTYVLEPLRVNGPGPLTVTGPLPLIDPAYVRLFGFAKSQ